jgi:lactoylglutathione lyase
MPTRFAHPHIRVQSIADSLEFYCGKLGLTEINRLEIEQPRLTLVYLAAPGDVRGGSEPAPVCLELAWLKGDGPITDGSRFAHVAFYVDDLVETCTRLEASGVAMPVPPQPDGHAYVLSPDGLTIELLQAPSVRA